MSPLPTLKERNDMLRTTFITGRVMLTEGILELPEAVKAEVLTKVRTFDQFTPDNDPFGEHDFGSITVDGAGKVFWKIDYYDRSMTMGTEDLDDPAQTIHVLTIMLASEY